MAIMSCRSRTEAAKIGGVGLQTVRDWALAFNAEGPLGLVNGKAPGNAPLLTDAHRQALLQIVESAADCRERPDPGGSRRGPLAAADDQGVDVQGPDVERLLPREGKEPMRQRARVFRRFGGARDETVNPVGAPNGEAPLDQVERTGYLADQVVEVVRDPASELT
jgi:transposase